VIGPNGAGKTILFRALLGIIPFSGIVRWREGIKIGYVPQKMDFDRQIPLMVKEFFLLKAKNFFFPTKEFMGHLDHELSLVGLSRDILNKPLGELSGGQLQRVLISWAMLDHPDILLFDEPTSGIDIGSEETIYNVMHRLQDERGTTILLISHDLNVVYRYASQVICLNKSLVCIGAPAEVLNPAQLVRLYGEGGFYHHLTHLD
jgi:zinc transport system ATP-binding protein